MIKNNKIKSTSSVFFFFHLIFLFSILFQRHFKQKGFKEFALGYVNPKTCFLNVSNGVIWTFLGPVLLVTFVSKY